MILTPILGGIIGYFTNWLAIKMLFKPYKEKRIAGFRLPFTPGLIPKERQELAKKIGETTTSHVLTDDVLAHALQSEEIRSGLEALVVEQLSKARQSDKTLGDILEGVQLPVHTLWPKINEGLLLFLDQKAQDPVFLDNLGEWITEAAAELLRHPGKLLPPDTLYNGLSNWLQSEGRQLLKGPGTDAFIRKLAQKAAMRLQEEPKTLGQLLPAKTSYSLKTFTESHVDRLGPLLADFLAKNPALDESLRQTVHQIARENFGSFIGIFINYDKIYENIKANVFAYLLTEENQALLTQKTGEAIDQLLAKDMGELLSILPDDTMTCLEDKLTALIQGLDTDALLGFLRQKLQNMEQSDLYGLIQGIVPDFRQKLKTIIIGVILNHLAPRAEHLIREKLPLYEEKLTAIPLGDIARKIPDSWDDKIKVGVLSLAATILTRGGGYVIQHIHVGQIIEDQINSFDMAETEEIIVSVVKKELWAITWLGGLLGLIIGFVPLITQWIWGI